MADGPTKKPAELDVSTVHPEYEDRLEEWRVMRVTVRGAGAVKDEGEEFLPAPSGFKTFEDGGAAMYSAYVTRAEFPELVKPTIQGMLGVVHQQEAQIELPAALDHLWEDADGRGTPLEALHRKITQEVLTTGRVALLADAPSEADGGGDPKIRQYVAESLINWSPDRDFFVLSEAAYVRDGFSWELTDRWRVLELAPPDAPAPDEEQDEDADGDEDETAESAVRPPSTEGLVYRQIVYDADGQQVGDPIVPARAGNSGRLDVIPLVVVGPRDLDVTPDDPPLLGVARAALAAYRLDADYRYQLFMTGQETLVTVGLDKADAPKYVGAGVVISLPEGGDAKYVGPSGEGINAHRQAILDERENAAALGARVFDTTQKAGVESGEALRIRRGATTATLVTVAVATAAGLEQALRHVGRLQGLTDAEVEEIVVAPNLDFVDTKLTADEANKLVSLWQSGAISYQTLYDNLQRGGVASYERSAEEEQELVEQENPGGLGDFQDGDLPPAPPPDEVEEGDPDGEDDTPELTDEELAELFGPAAMREVAEEDA